LDDVSVRLQLVNSDEKFPVILQRFAWCWIFEALCIRELLNNSHVSSSRAPPTYVTSSSRGV